MEEVSTSKEDNFSPNSTQEEDEILEDWGNEEEEEEGSETDPHSLSKEDFFGCYLLVSKNPKFKGRTYIGYTVNPKRRIRQHNAGSQKGGARRTSGRGPWLGSIPTGFLERMSSKTGALFYKTIPTLQVMVLIVHGFPNDVSALRFEWAWQHPAKSRRLGSGIAPGKKSRESSLEHRFRILGEMLCVSPWKRLPLTIRWLLQEYQIQFSLNRQPPMHMPIAYGPVELSSGRRSGDAKKTSSSQESQPETEDSTCEKHCYICHQIGGNEEEYSLLNCYHTSCPLSAHLTCLAERLCPSPQIIPTVGPCPSCRRELLWGEMIRRSKRRRM